MFRQYSLRFYAYTVVDLVERGVLTIVVEIRRYRIAAIIIIILKKKKKKN